MKRGRNSLHISKSEDTVNKTSPDGMGGARPGGEVPSSTAPGCMSGSPRRHLPQLRIHLALVFPLCRSAVHRICVNFQASSCACVTLGSLSRQSSVKWRAKIHSTPVAHDWTTAEAPVDGPANQIPGYTVKRRFTASCHGAGLSTLRSQVQRERNRA